MRSFLPFVLCCVCAAQGPQVPAPVLTFDKLHHDFGKVSVDRKVTHGYKATNTGSAPLQISQIIPSCGCTYMVGGQWYLKPGESTVIDATFDPKGMRGAVRKSMQVVSNDPVNPNIRLSFEAEVIQDVIPSTTMLFFDAVPRNAPRKGVVRLESGNGQAVQVIDAKIPAAPYLTATVKAEGKDALVEVQLDASKVASGKQSGVDVMTIRTTSERSPLITVNIQWFLRAAVLASPTRLAWVETAGRELRTSVQLKQVEGRAFKVLSARPTSDLIRVEGLGRPAAAQQDLTVVFSAKAKAGTYNDRIVLQLDDPEQPELELRVSAVLR